MAILRTRDDIAVLDDDYARQLEEETRLENPEIYDRRERLFHVLEYELRGDTTPLKVVRAINRGVGQEHILALQQLVNQNDYAEYFLYGIVPDEIARAIMNYQPRNEKSQSNI